MCGGRVWGIIDCGEMSSKRPVPHFKEVIQVTKKWGREV